MHEVGDGSMVNWCIGEDTSNVSMCTPQVVADDLAAAKVVDLETEVTTALIRFEQRRICVCAKILSHTYRTHSTLIIC